MREREYVTIYIYNILEHSLSLVEFAVFPEHSYFSVLIFWSCLSTIDTFEHISIFLEHFAIGLF